MLTKYQTLRLRKLRITSSCHNLRQEPMFSELFASNETILCCSKPGLMCSIILAYDCATAALSALVNALQCPNPDPYSATSALAPRAGTRLSHGNTGHGPRCPTGNSGPGSPCLVTNLGLEHFCILGTVTTGQSYPVAILVIRDSGFPY
jgi:hypothetical protein